MTSHPCLNLTECPHSLLAFSTSLPVRAGSGHHTDENRTRSEETDDVRILWCDRVVVDVHQFGAVAVCITQIVFCTGATVHNQYVCS
jgi:hypothetical protein